MGMTCGLSLVSNVKLSKSMSEKSKIFVRYDLTLTPKSWSVRMATDAPERV